MEEFEVGCSPDVVDQGSNHAEVARTQQVAALRAKLKPEQVRDANGNWPEPACVDCGLEIPEDRLELTGSTRCVFCQAKRERLYRR